MGGDATAVASGVASHVSPTISPPSTRKLRSSKMTEPEALLDVLDDRGSTTSKSEGSSSSHGRGDFAEAALSPSSSSLSSSTSQQQQHDDDDDDDDVAPARPAYLYVDGEDAEPPAEPVDDIKGVPVFTPTWEEFKDFYSYCSRIDEWGMRAGIVKIIPPKEWTDALPHLDGRTMHPKRSAKAGERYTDANRLSQVRIKNSIEQIFTPAGTGVWRQSNVVHPSRIINAKQWADTCAQDAQRGPEMRRMREVAQRKEADEDEDGVRTRSGRGRGSAAQTSAAGPTSSTSSPLGKRARKDAQEDKSDSVDEGLRKSPRKSDGAAKTSGNPSKPKMADRTSQEEWDNFDYVRDWCKEAGIDAQPDDWSMSTCRAIEQEYWRGLNYGKAPMYGADLAGTLFTSDTQHWNIGRLDNILTRLRLKRKLPGVTTPYLYFGMWRATFAWHVEDMDLYSINYIHFGAPKQWYSIRQADKQRFELAMAAAFPADSSRCRHFMRHKSYLASPAFLRSAAGSVKPLRLVQKAQEIVITYPYGYHSGYNLGFNCAESVNFALERWLDIGRKAGYCDCTNDSVKMDVDAMLEESREIEELDRKRVERERRREEEEDFAQKNEEERAEIRRAKERERRKRKKEEQAQSAGLDLSVDDDYSDAAPSSKKSKKENVYPCEFCVSMTKEDLVVIAESGDSSKEKRPPGRAHRLCASFLPETWIEANPKAEKNARAPKELVMGFDGIAKARWSLKCQNCKDKHLQKRGAKVQCTYGRCSRTSHVGCALSEEHGWMLDVLPNSEADVIEGKVNGKPLTKGKGAKATASRTTKEDEQEDEEESPRMVVLCQTHNPREREREARRKSMVVREFLSTLSEGQMICIRTSSGVWETPFVQYIGPHKEEDTLDEGEVELIDGSRIKGGRVVIDAAAWRKADDTVWYREEAKADRLEEEERQRKLSEKKKGKSDVLKVRSSGKDDVKAVKADISADEKPKVQKEESTIAAPVASTTISAAQTSQPASLQYIRDWKPRETHAHPASYSTPFQHAHPHASHNSHHPMSSFTTPNHFSQIGSRPLPALQQPWHAHYGTLPDKRMHHAAAQAHSQTAMQSFGPLHHLHDRFASRQHAFPDVHPSYRQYPPAFSPSYTLHSSTDPHAIHRLPSLQQQTHHRMPHELISPRSMMNEDKFRDLNEK